MIDCEHFHGNILGFEFKAELLPNRGEDRRARLVAFRASQARGLSLIGRPIQCEVVISCEAGMVEDGVVQLLRQQLSDLLHRQRCRGVPFQTQAPMLSHCRSQSFAAGVLLKKSRHP